MSMKSLIEIEGILVRLVGVFNIIKIWIGQLLTLAIYHQFGHIVQKKRTVGLAIVDIHCNLLQGFVQA